MFVCTVGLCANVTNHARGFRLFIIDAEIAKCFDAEDIDPDMIPKSRKFQQLGQAAIQEIFRLPFDMEEGRLSASVKHMAIFYKEQGLVYDQFKAS